MFQVGYTPIIWPFVISLVISIFLAVYAFRHRHVPTANTFAWTMVAMSIWTLCYVLDIITVTLEGKIFWAKMKYFGSVPGPMLNAPSLRDLALPFCVPSINSSTLLLVMLKPMCTHVPS